MVLSATLLASLLLLAPSASAANHINNHNNAAAGVGASDSGDGSRVEVPFQYAWRFHYGDDPSSPPESGPGTANFTTDLTGLDLCEGMEHNPNRFSLKDCRMACMYDPKCLVWQAFPLEYGRACYHGYQGMNITCEKAPPKNPTHMGGGRRDKSPDPPFRTDYSFATEDAASEIDEHWDVVDAPHDFLASYGHFANNSEDFKQGYVPRNASWYRKHFNLPQNWKDDQNPTFVHFEGVFHHATLFLNGHYLMQHECGYTGFDVRLDNATAATAMESLLRYGPGKNNENVLSLRADASFGSGHWYEGGGIYRNVHLVHAPTTHIVRDGFFVAPAGGIQLLAPSVELETTNPDGAQATVQFQLFDTDGHTVLATSDNVPATVPKYSPDAANTVVVTAKFTSSVAHSNAGNVSLWTTKSPTLYPVRVSVSVGGAVVDTQTVSTGFRTAEFTGTDGEAPFKLNGDPIKFRGFSHHNSIGGLGTAIPERVDLFRAQSSRALGSNIWRMSHNPYTPALYSLLDAVGIMVWDENRDYGAKYMEGAYAIAMHDMVKRDRNHPSIIIWSFCNEFECQQNDPEYSGNAYRHAAKSADPTRPVTANGNPNAASLDVQGFSHSSNKTFISWHENTNKSEALVLSECCSCTSQREDRSLPTCIADQNSPGLLPYVTGSLGVWTLQDYFGEPGGGGWPHVSCDFGQFDIAGFVKPHAYWYRSNWLQGFGEEEPGRPPLPFKTVARILDMPAVQAPDASPHQYQSVASISGITTAPFAQIVVDGVVSDILATPHNDLGEVDPMQFSIPSPSGGACNESSFAHNASGVQCKGLKKVTASSRQDCAQHCCSDATCNTWQLSSTAGCWVGFAPTGSCAPNPERPDIWVGGQRSASYSVATLNALDGSDPATAKVLASHTIYTAGASNASYRIKLTVDVPSKTTGTGEALLLDGRDTALIRATIVDSAHHDAIVSTATNRITWTVVSGPGRMNGISSGDPTSHEFMKSNSINAYLGLARGMVTVTEDCTSSSRDIALAVDADAGRGPATVHTNSCDTSAIEIEASAPGLGSARITVPVSVDPRDAAMEVARMTGGSFADGFSYLDNFVG